jgi:hypothetical protein
MATVVQTIAAIVNVGQRRHRRWSVPVLIQGIDSAQPLLPGSMARSDQVGRAPRGGALDATP